MLRCKIRDATFAHDRSATAWKVPQYLEWARDDSPTNGPDFYVDGHLFDSDIPKYRVNIGWLHEPPELVNLVYAHAPDAAVSGRFSTILTYHPDLLALPGFTFAPYGGVWIERPDWGLHPKRYLCSMLYGHKRSTSGHRIRPLIADVLPNYSAALFGARGTPTDYSIRTKLMVHKPYAFSIVCEAQRLDNLFTEILCDCFALGTIPIFWGAPNIGDYFNADGILSFETPAQCADIVAGLSFELYQSMLPAVADNLARVAQYAVAEDWMYANVLKEYDK